MREAQKNLAYAEEQMMKQNHKSQDILHKLELEKTTYNERAKLATELMNVRQERRKWKDEVEEYEEIVKFAVDYKSYINQLEQLLGKVKQVEKYHLTRRYVPKCL